LLALVNAEKMAAFLKSAGDRIAENFILLSVLCAALRVLIRNTKTPVTRMLQTVRKLQ